MLIINKPIYLICSMVFICSSCASTSSNDLDDEGFGFLRELSARWPTTDFGISSNYGYRWGRKHHGIDIKGDQGNSIYATYTGIVEFSGWQNGYGKTIVVKHNGFKSLYAHCKKLYVKNGQPVRKGQKIADIGATGNVTGPHLHFELRDYAGNSINPLLLFAEQNYF